ISYADGSPVVLCREAIAEDAYRVNITPDGAIAVTGHSDGTLRWYRISRFNKGCHFEPLLTVHISEYAPGKWTWAAWRPAGKFGGRLARGVESRIPLEWQRAGKDGGVVTVPLERAITWYDWDAVKNALQQTADDSDDPFKQPDARVVLDNASPPRLIQILD